ncbi:MAG: putative lipoprotein ChiQ [Candidatus Erwinia impunctatus]|nr:putative lipoprotein ChiQ [Culicoides impunctatus]
MKKGFALAAVVLALSACTQESSAPKERISTLDYQRCLDAEQMGGGDVIEARCDRLLKEIEHN